MRHDWIYDVLTDLRSYAEKNGLFAIAAQADQMLDTARVELGNLARAQNDTPLDVPANDSVAGNPQDRKIVK